MQFTAKQIAEFLGGELAGDPDASVWTISKIEEGTPGALSFLSNPKYEPYAYDSKASVIIVNRDFEPKSPVSATLVKVDDAYGCFAKLLELYAASRPRKTGVSDKAVIGDNTKIGENAYIGHYAVIGDNTSIGNDCAIHPHVYVGDNVRMGDNVTLHSGVKIYEACVIGSNVTIHANSVIGADGFGFAPNAAGEFDKIPQIGNVVIGDNVDIGANTCIDRATMGSTVIKDGVKLDNLIQVGHNVVIDQNTVCAAQVGIAGSVKIGRNCMFGGQVGIAGHLNIGDRVQVGSKGGVSNNVADGEIMMGYPALPVSKFHRSNAVYRNLPGMSSDIHQLKKDIKSLREELETK